MREGNIYSYTYILTYIYKHSKRTRVTQTKVEVLVVLLLGVRPSSQMAVRCPIIGVVIRSPSARYTQDDAMDGLRSRGAITLDLP